MRRREHNTEIPVIYELPVRNFSEEGTIESIAGKVEKIKNLGVDVIWLMPIYESAKINKKGEAGSPYAITDHRKIDSRYGNEEDLKKLIERAHRAKLKVIMDMVFHHTSLESELLNEHPEWYLMDINGKPARKFKEWSDICDFDYSKDKGLWEYNISVMEKWYNLGIDGFRCDIVTLMPMEFWLEAKKRFPDAVWVGEIFENSLVKVLRECGIASYSAPEMHRVFEITYDYDGYEYLKEYFAGNISLKNYIEYIKLQESIYPENAVKMRFLENHDQPRIADIIDSEIKLKNWTIFYFFLKGATLINAGQEYMLSEITDLFNKKAINWSSGNQEFYEFFKYGLKLAKGIKERCNRFKINMVCDGVVKIEWKSKSESYVIIVNLEGKYGAVEIGENITGFEMLTHKKIEIKNNLKLLKEPIIVKISTV